jgi:transposase
MPTTFRDYVPDQDLLLPANVREWLPAARLAYFISEIIDGLDLGAFYAPYEGDGRCKMPYEPSMMLKVWVYAYATGVFSSRKIAAKLEEDVAFRVLAAGNFPAHRTLCGFRKRHLTDFKAVFVQAVQLTGEVGLVSLAGC